MQAISWTALPPEHLATQGFKVTRPAVTSKQEQSGTGRGLTAGTAGQLAVLCFSHSVVSWGLFVLQNWIPTYLTALGHTDFAALGILSALPWLVSPSTPKTLHAGEPVCNTPCSALRMIVQSLSHTYSECRAHINVLLAIWIAAPCACVCSK